MTEVQVAGTTIRHSGPGPYVARSASDKRDDWPFWMVVDATGFNGLEIAGTLAKFVSAQDAKLIAGALNADHFIVVPCKDPGAEGLSVIWDREAEQVIDVMTHDEVSACFGQGGAA